MTYTLLVKATAQSLSAKLSKKGFKKDRFGSYIEVRGGQYSSHTRVWVYFHGSSYAPGSREEQEQAYYQSLEDALTESGFYFERNATAGDTRYYMVWQDCPKGQDYRFWNERSGEVRVRHEDGRVTKLREHPEVKAEADRRGRETAKRVREAKETEEAAQKRQERVLKALNDLGVSARKDYRNYQVVQVDTEDLERLLGLLKGGVPLGA